MDRPLPNSYWVEPGTLLAGEHPHAGGVPESGAGSRLQRLLDAGIDAFIDLTHAGERPPYELLLPPTVSYRRSAIDDGSVPADATQMREIQAHLRACLAAGQRVYVHCRAGIGRTGTVIGCYLADQGLDGSTALARLNELWVQSARSASWPAVPQTPRQAEYIRDWPAYRLAVAQAAESGGSGAGWARLSTVRRRFLGAMRGLALGDALGISTQYRRPGTFVPLADMAGGGPFDLARGMWSDETALVLCTAESLIACHGSRAEDRWARIRRWQREGYLAADERCIGITAATARVLGGWTDSAVVSNEAAPVARVAPYALYFWGRAGQAREAVTQMGREVHATRGAQRCCELALAMLQAALDGQALTQVLRPAGIAPETLPPLLTETWEAPSEPVDAEREEPAVRVLVAVRQALAAGTPFRAGLLQVINQGGDADVAGALYGQIAGALAGAPGLPRGWVAALARAERIEDLADQLLTAALTDLDP